MNFALFKAKGPKEPVETSSVKQTTGAKNLLSYYIACSVLQNENEKSSTPQGREKTMTKSNFHDKFASKLQV